MEVKIKYLFLRWMSKAYFHYHSSGVKIHKPKTHINKEGSSIYFINYTQHDDLLLFPFICDELQKNNYFCLFENFLDTREAMGIFSNLYKKLLPVRLIENDFENQIECLKNIGNGTQILVFCNFNRREFSKTLKFFTYLKTTFPNINCNYITITYKNNIHIKPIVYLNFTFQGCSLSQILEKREPLKSIQKNLVSNITIFPIHLFSYALFSSEIHEGIARKYIFYKMNRLANSLFKNKVYVVSRECLEQSYDELFAILLQDAIDNGYLTYKPQKKYKATEKLFKMIEGLKTPNQNSENVYAKSYFELKPKIKILDQIWKDIEIYD